MARPDTPPSPEIGEFAIWTESLTREFSTVRTEPGLLGRVRTLLHPVREVKTVVREVSLRVRKGELLGLLGPNGAGKSTLIKMLTGVLRPSSGTVLVNGRVPYRNRSRNALDIGLVMGQRTQLWWDLPARDSFTVLRDIYGLERGVFERRMAEFDELLELSSFWHTPARHLSLGQRVRCDLAAALIHDPRVVFLDEPTIGMDVVVKEKVRAFLSHLIETGGHTVVLTTHDMTEVERLCDRVVLIGDGKLVFDGALAELKSRAGGGDLVHVTYAAPGPRPRLRSAELVLADGVSATFRPLPGRSAQAVVAELLAGPRMTGVSIEQSPLEDLIRGFYQGEGVGRDRHLMGAL